MKVKMFVALNERQILEEMKDSFTKSPISTRNAVKAINNLFYSMSTRNLSESAIKDIYITVLKGFQSKDHYLKLCIYSAIEEISKHIDDGLIGVNVLINDLNGKLPDEIKAMALRTLFFIVPPDMVYDFGKYVSQAFISTSVIRKDASILVSHRLLCNNFTQVKKWLDGIEMVNDPIMNYHVIGFMMQSRRLKLNNVENLRGPSGILGVRMVMESLNDNKEALSILKKFLNSKYSDEMVFIEAAKSVCNLSEEYAAQFISQTVQSLRIFLKSTNVVLQFSAMRIISQLALKYPHKVAIANKEIEDLVSSDNKTISMFAITALLKTGNEETVDRLANLIPGMINDMSESFKKIAIETLESLSESFDSKRPMYIDFLGNSLLQKGELEFKKYIIDVIGRAIKNDNSRERILDLLCTYIEDSQYYQITLDILGIFGREIPKSKVPSKYVVHVLNRLILENNHVRVAALQCLYNISNVISSRTVENAMTRCLHDQDEMIREVSGFLLRNMRSIKSESFDLEELGDLKESVMCHLGKNEKKEEIIKDMMIKECREIILSSSNADVQVKMVKRIYEDKILFVFSIENKLEEVQICDGLLRFVSGGDDKMEMSMNIEQINPLESLVIEREWNVKEGCVINGMFDYTICVEGDIEDTETESITLEPFQVTILDFVRPIGTMKNSGTKKEAVFALQGDMYTAGKKILDLLNMKIINQEPGNNTMTISLVGEYNTTSITIYVELTCNTVCKCLVDVYCDDDEVGSKIIELFE